MQIIIDSPRLTISKTLHDLIHSKMTRLASMNSSIIRCKMVLKKVKNDHKENSFIEARLSLPGKIMFASEQAETLETALDELIDDFRNQLYHYKND